VLFVLFIYHLHISTEMFIRLDLIFGYFMYFV